MSSEHAPLTGIDILHPPLQEISPRDNESAFLREFRERNWAELRALDQARALGATLIPSDGSLALHTTRLAQPNTYTLLGLKDHGNETLTDLLQDPANDIQTPWSKNYTACTPAELSNLPYVLAFPGLDGGTGKYYIEQPQQLQRFQQIVDVDHAQYSWGSGFDVREYIPTPSEHFTSYRALVSPTGDILSAGLLYSAHTKADALVRTMPIDETEPVPEYQDMMVGVSLLDALEDPRSPYFLASRNILPM